MTSYTDSIIRDMRRDTATKARLRRGVASFLRFATDAEESEKVEQMSATEFALKCLQELKKRGLIDYKETKDPVTALESYLAGMKDAAERPAGRRSASDSAEGSFVDRYLRGA